MNRREELREDPQVRIEPARKTRAPRRQWAGYLVAPAMLGAVVFAGWVLLQGPTGVLPWILGVAVFAPLIWIVTSSLWPAKADRTCPRCKSEELERMDPESTVGIVCRACGHRDEGVSSWLLAEEEGPLEDIVLGQRNRTRGRIVMAPRALRKLENEADGSSGVDRGVRAN